MRSIRLLTDVFLRRFLENDLISPDTDHMQIVATTIGGVSAAGIFVTVLMWVKYWVQVFPSPRFAEVIELDDQFLFCAWPMLVMAIVTLIELDALGLDARDSSILGPLPISRGAIVRAKLTAVGLFGGVFLMALTLAPALLYPVGLLTGLPATLGTAAVLTAAQLISSLAAGLFGFGSVLAIHECLQAVLGPDLFHRVSRGVQVMCLTCCATMLLLMPLASSRVAARFANESPSARLWAPDWFVALHETLGGHLLEALPQARLPPRVAQQSRLADGLYRAASPEFPGMSRRAVGALLVVCVVAIGGFAWNARRLAPPAFERRHASQSRWFRYPGTVLIPRNPTAKAGFLFAVRTLTRSTAHRLAMAAAAAAALAASLVVVQAAIARGGRMSPWVFAVEPFVLAVLLAGFRYAVTVPAELRAAWSVSMAWRGRVRLYFAGVKRAAILGLVVPAIVVFEPVYRWMAGWRSAAWLAAFGFLLGWILVELLMLGQRALPFMTKHVRSENFNMIAPYYVVAFLAGSYAFGQLEDAALSGSNAPLVLALTLAVGIVLLRLLDARRRAAWAGLELENDTEFVSLIE